MLTLTLQSFDARKESVSLLASYAFRHIDPFQCIDGSVVKATWQGTYVPRCLPFSQLIATQYSLGFCTTQITNGAIVTAGSHIGMKVRRSSRSSRYKQRLLTTSQVGEVTTLGYDDQIQPPVYNFSVRNNSLTSPLHYLSLAFRPRRHWPMRRITSVVSTTLDIPRTSVSVCGMSSVRRHRLTYPP